MNSRRMALIGTMLWLAIPAQAAQQTGKPTKPAPSAPAPADPIQTQAVFVNPRNQQEGRDPFFPRSMLPYTRYNPPVTTNRAVSVSADLKLSGISGSSEHRLAIINNKTFEINEEGDVISGSDKVRIRCLEIKPESVIIQFVTGGLRREIHLRRGL